VTSIPFGYPGTTPGISAFGTTGGIVWAYERTSGATPGNAVLHTYDALKLATELYNSTQNSARDSFGLAAAIKFATPTVCNGKVYVGAGELASGFCSTDPTPATEVTAVYSWSLARSSTNPQRSTTIQLSWIDAIPPPAGPAIAYDKIRVLAGPNSR
jgi:hypothetical protein